MQFPVLSDDQRQTIKKYGTPMPIVDRDTNDAYILLRVEFASGSDQDGFTARVPGIEAYGEGETAQEASLALCEALRGYFETFNDR